jgi:hypothetical protein
MRIVEAVKRSINEGDDSLWSEYVRRGWLHSLHVEIYGPDGRDHRNYRRLVRNDYSSRMALQRFERGDGTFQPLLIEQPWWITDRRQGERLGKEFRRNEVGSGNAG